MKKDYLWFYYKEKNHYWYLFIYLDKKEYESFWSNYNLNNWYELKYNQLYHIIENLKENWYIEKQ
jgi:hypothetical protein